MVVLICALTVYCVSVMAEQPTSGTAAIGTVVTRMARIGRTFSPTFSPDGSRIAFVSDLNGVPQVWIVATGGGYPQLVTAGDDPITKVQWSPNNADSLAYVLAPGGGMNSQIYVVHPDGTGVRLLTAGGKEDNGLNSWTDDGRLLMVNSNVGTPTAIQPYLLDPVNGKMEMLSEAEGSNILVDVSRDGKCALISRIINRGDNNLYLLNLKTHHETLLTPHSGTGSFGGKMAPDARTIYLLSNKDRDLLAFARMKLDSAGTPGPIEIIAERPRAELDEFELNEQGTIAALLWNVGGRSDLAFIELPSGKLTPGPELPGEFARGLTFSPDGKYLAMVISGATSPSNVWVMDILTKHLRQLTFSPHAGVNLSDLIRPELVTFKAQDGIELSGWLYRPKGQHASGPYVLSFHGGPEDQERPTFHADYQALLAQGIGVFAPNVRGSSGSGKKFMNLDNGALRVNAVRDIKTCVDYLIAAGVADPKKIGIMGESYGGYMTMAGVTEFPDLFAAGVDLYGIVNFATFFQHTEPGIAAVSRVEYGDPVKDAALLKSLSPLYKLDRTKAAIMVQHGANDTNVPLVEAEQIVNELKDRGIPVEFVLFPDEGHSFRKVNNRIKSTVSMVEFFTSHLTPGSMHVSSQ